MKKFLDYISLPVKWNNWTMDNRDWRCGMKNNKGFSLIELITSVAIMSIVMLIATTMMSNASRYFERQSAEVELQNEAQIVTNYLSEAFMEATTMECKAESFTESGGILQLTGNMTIVLHKTKTDALGNVSADGKGEQRILYLEENPVTEGYSLYMVSFDSEDAIPSPSTYKTPGYLLTDSISGVYITIPYSEIEDEDGEPDADGNLPMEACLTNPLKVRILFTLQHSIAVSHFEMEVNCRNMIEKVTVTDSSGTVYEYDVYNR